MLTGVSVTYTICEGTVGKPPIEIKACNVLSAVPLLSTLPLTATACPSLETMFGLSTSTSELTSTLVLNLAYTRTIAV